MLKHLSEITATLPLGQPTGQKLFRVESGPNINRRVVLFAAAPNAIVLCWSDSPYLSWSAPQTVVSDCDNSSFDAAIDSQGNLIIAYTDLSTAHLVTRRLTLTNGTWTPGSKVTVYDNASGYDPCLRISSTGTLWLAWKRQVVPSSWIYVKSSHDGGLTWGAGSSDAGDQISQAATFVWSRLLIGPADIFVFCTYGNSRITLRSLSIGGGPWGTESTVYTSSNVSGEFDVALTDSGGLALVLCDALPKYREFDGFTWGAVQQLDSLPAASPQISIHNSNPVIMLISGVGPNQSALKYTARVGGQFQPLDFVDRRARTFDRVLLYHQFSGAFHDATTAAADSMTGDVYHPQSGALVAAVGDRSYVGLDDQFRYLTILLSTIGAGGTVSYNYWDGSGWKIFTPASGASNLLSAAAQILLWNDYESIPRDWQKTTINADRRFWIKIEVTSAYTTAPIAYQITAVSDLKQIAVRR
jgi:hypothetical protein